METHTSAPGAYWKRLKDWISLHKKGLRLALAAVFLVYVAAYQLVLKAPSGFPENEIVRVEKGMGLSAIAADLERKNVVRSPFLFELVVRLFGASRGVMAGEYLFTDAAFLPRVVYRLLAGDFGISPVTVTIPEGSTLEDIAGILARRVPSIDREIFLNETKGKEGYLFPDTYYFFPNAHMEDVIAEMERNFGEKISTLRDDIEKTGKTLRDVVIMASILEHEARTSDDRKIIAGILWKRIDIGMALQVDAPFQYAVGKNTYELTTADLALDSPYNTYTRRGLPAGPIGNPGLDSILAAIHPAESPYLYYLSDREGNTYYSATFEGHRENKARYIR